MRCHNSLAQAEQAYFDAWATGETDVHNCERLASWHLENNSYVEARKYLGHLCSLDVTRASNWISLSV